MSAYASHQSKKQQPPESNAADHPIGVATSFKQPIPKASSETMSSTMRVWSELFNSPENGNAASSNSANAALGTCNHGRGFGTAQASQSESPLYSGSSSVAGTRPPSSLRSVPATPKPLVNSGNRCFANVVLQALLHSQCFYTLMQDEVRPRWIGSPRAELVRCLLQFIEEASVLSLSEPLKEAAMDNSKPVDSNAVDNIIFALSQSTGAFLGYEQQDAEEFLTALLTQLSDELSLDTNGDHAAKESSFGAGAAVKAGDRDGEWLEVGPKRRISRTRQLSLSSAPTPLTRLFGGTLRSTLLIPGARPSVSVEPFLVLPLALTATTRRLEDALLLAVRDELIPWEGSARPARKQLLLAELPKLLIIQLKRFVISNSHATSKLRKQAFAFKSPLALRIPPECTHSQRVSHPAPEYRLSAVIYHHGDSIDSGHYTAQLVTPTGCWRFDDDRPVCRIASQELEQDSTNSYLLFYELK